MPEVNPNNKNEDVCSRLKLKNLVNRIKELFPNECGSYKALVGAANLDLETGQGLGSAILNGYSRTTDKHTQSLCNWLHRKKLLKAELIEADLDWKLLDVNPKSTAIISKPLNFMSFMREVLEMRPGMDINILGTWPSAFVGKENQAAMDILRNMINYCKTVQLLQPRPDSRFYAKRLYTQFHNDVDGDGAFEKSKEDLFATLEKLNKLKLEFIKTPGKFEFKLYDDSPGMRLFAHAEQIYVSMLLDNKESNETFSTIYPNDAKDAATQLRGHFDQFWLGATEYQNSGTRERFNLRLIGDLAGVYKVFNYCHIADVENNTGIPATQIGALTIHPNGFVEQRTFRGDYEEPDRNEGRALRVGNNLYLEVRNVRAPKFTAFSILRSAKAFNGSSGQYLFGTLIVPKKKNSNPTALRMILQRQPNETDLQTLPCTKVSLSETDTQKLIPSTVRQFLSGVFRNMLRFIDDEILNDFSLEQEMKFNRVKLGKLMFIYAKALKNEPGNEVEMVSAVRWALTHGYKEWEKVQDVFGEEVITDKTIIDLFNRIRAENPNLNKVKSEI